MYVVLSFYLIDVELLNILLQFFDLQPHRQVVVPLFFPDVLLLEVDDLVLDFACRRMHHFHGIIYLRHAVDIETVFLLSDHCVYIVIFSPQKFHDRVAYTEGLDRYYRAINAKVRPVLSLKDHIWTDNTSFANCVKCAMLIIAIGELDVYNARLQDVYFGAWLSYTEQVLIFLEKFLLRPVEQLTEDVLVGITQEFYIVLA